MLVKLLSTSIFSPQSSNKETGGNTQQEVCTVGGEAGFSDSPWGFHADGGEYNGRQIFYTG